MRVLLTGASGFLGSQFLLDGLTETDLEFVCPVSFRHRGVPERLTEVRDAVGIEDWDRVTVVTCDLAAPINDTTDKLIGDIDIVVNFASESHIPRSIEYPVPFVQNNVNLMLYLLDWAKNRTLDAFVHVSTDEVYGPIAKFGHSEWDPIVPSTPYSASKAAQEALAISWWRSYGLPLVLVNTMNPLGYMQDPEKFLPLVMSKVLAGETVQIHASADGVVGSRVYIDTSDLASAIMFLISKRRAYRYREGHSLAPARYNVSGERDVTNEELAQLIADEMNLPLIYEVVASDRPGHGLRYALDSSKIEDLGWQRQFTIEKTVSQVVKWTLDRPLWLERRPR